MHVTVGDYVYQIRIYDESCEAMQGWEPGSVFAMDTETVPIKHGHPIIPAFLQVCNHAMRFIDVVPAHLIVKYLTEFYQRNHNFVVAFHNAPFDLEVLGIKQEHNKPLLLSLIHI